MKNQIVRIKLGLAVFCGALLIPCLVLGTKTAVPGSEKTESVVSSTVETAGDETAQKIVNRLDEQQAVAAKDKTESVHVKATADGTPEEITVDVTLKNPGSSAPLKDKTNLEDIKNTEGDEEYTLQSDGTLLWENKGTDIQYKGTSKEKLPVSVKVTYTLNGKEMQPDQLAGKSGRLKIRFDYENQTTETIRVEGENVTVKVPFVMLSALFFDEDTAANIEVENGKVVDMDGQSVVIGYALPGLADSLKLTDFEPTEDMDIPEYVEVSADVTDFSLDFTATIASTGMFSELDTDKLSDADELSDAMNDLNEASGKLVDGMSSLFDGVSAFNDSMGTYLKGVKTVDSGVTAFKTALGQMDAQKSALQTGAKTLADSLSEINKQLQQIPDSAEEADKDGNMKAALDAASTLSTDAKKLLAVIDSMKTSMAQAKTFVGTAETYRDQVKTKTEAAEKEISEAQKLLEDVTAKASVDKDKITVQTGDISKAVKEAVKTETQKAVKDKGLSDEDAETVAEKAAEEAAKAVKSGDAKVDVPDDAVKVETEGKDKVEQQLKKAADSLADMPPLDIPDLSLDTTAIDSVLSDIQTQLIILKTYADAISGGEAKIETLEATLAQLKTGASALATGSSQLSAGINALTDGISKLYTGSTQLKKGTSALVTADPSISKGLSALKDGAKALKDGMQTFDEDGIQELTDLAGDDLTNLIDRIKGLKDADISYDTYSGLAAGSTGEVRFIIETDSIEKEK